MATTVKTPVDEALALINESVRTLKAYHLTPEICGVKLNQNENPCDWDKGVKERAAAFFVERPWNRYPDFVPDALKSRLAAHIGVTPESVIVGNGSNEMLLVLMLSFAAKAKSVIICSPTFSVYRLLRDGMGMRPVDVSLTNDLRYDIPAVKKAAADNPGAMLIICSPNNPVGNTVDESGLRDILSVHTGVCVLDQAYVEFGGFNALGLINEHKNLIIARTFSKAMAAAGIRLGYMVGAPDVIAEINKIKLPYNINFFTEHAASTILDNVSMTQKSIEMIIGERERLYDYLKALPFDNVYPSAANFVLIRTKDKQKLFDHLKKCDILVRDVSSYRLLENCLRFSIGTPEENTLLLESLKSFFEPGLRRQK
ncbi:MAG: histidinol-phosphate transaminase [Chitinispirillales bacterium]|jgi:histidinol-phosphate aminotransferase|nr:histidinol-phosphate transaminase [Chitinispirillales bacterium]